MRDRKREVEGREWRGREKDEKRETGRGIGRERERGEPPAATGHENDERLAQ